MGNDHVCLPLIRRKERLFHRGDLHEDEWPVGGVCTCGCGPGVLNPAVEVIAECKPESLDVGLDNDVDELLGSLLLGVQKPAYEPDSDWQRLLP